MVRCLFIRLKASSFPKGTVFAFLLLALSADWTAAAAEDRIVVASKIDTEGALLGNMILALLEARGLAVGNKVQLGPTNIVRAAILAGQIDIYPEYTGNGALFFHMENDPAWKNWGQGYALVERLCRERNRLVWLQPAPANNTWVIAVRKDLAERRGLKSMGDFAKYLAEGGRIKLAASAEFVESPAALPAFEATYGFRLSDQQLLTLSGGNTAATLRAAAEQCRASTPRWPTAPTGRSRRSALSRSRTIKARKSSMRRPRLCASRCCSSIPRSATPSIRYLPH